MRWLTQQWTFSVTCGEGRDLQKIYGPPTLNRR